MSDMREFKWKQCLVVRADIKMSCGKKCAQIAHAAIGGAYEKADKTAKKAWLDEGAEEGGAEGFDRAAAL